MPGKKMRGKYSGGGNMSSMAKSDRTSRGANGSMMIAKSSNYTGIYKAGGNVRTTLGRSASGKPRMRKGKRRGVYQAGDTHLA